MDSKQIRIVYMGTPDFAVTPLRYLVENGYNVVGVVTMPDKPAGRGLRMQESAVKRYAVEAGLPVLQPEKLRDPQFIEEFRALRADLGIVIAFRMLPEVIWAMPALGTFNLHASLLPQYRGAAPINWAVINGETMTGVTTFMLNHEIDKGDILGRKQVAIEPDDNAGTLHDKLMYAGTGLVAESIGKIAAGHPELTDQEQVLPERLHAAPKIFKETCRIDWTRSAADIHNLIRGLSPYPAAWSPLEKTDGTPSAEPLSAKIYAAQPEPVAHTHAPGTLISDDKSYIKVACADGYIRIDELQLSGKKRMHTPELLRGFKGIGDYRFG